MSRYSTNSSSSNNNTSLIKESLDYLESEFETHCQNLRNENEMLILLLKKNLQTELLQLPVSIRKMTMEDFLQQCLDSNSINNIITPTSTDLNNINNNNNKSSSNNNNNNNNNNNINNNTHNHNHHTIPSLQSPTTTQFYNNNKESALSLGELLMTPDRPIKNMNEFKQKVINILNSPQLLNSNNNNNINNSSNNNNINNFKNNKRIIITDEDDEDEDDDNSSQQDSDSDSE